MEGKRITLLLSATLGFACFYLGAVFSIGAFATVGLEVADIWWVRALWPSGLQPVPDFLEKVEWADLAGAWMTACAAFFGVAALAFVAKQVEIARSDRDLNDRSARLNAYIIKERAARARVETIWKGSELAFERQEFDGEDFDRIGRHLAREVFEPTARERILNAVAEWKRNKSDLDVVLAQFEQELRDLEAGKPSALPPRGGERAGD